MTSVSHSELVGAQLHVPFQFVQEGDPGAGSPGAFWLKVSTGDLKRRTDADDGWDPVGGSGGAVDSDIYANLPAAGTAGRLYLPTDAPVLLRDDGAAWQSFGPLHALDASAKPSTAYNHTSETVTQYGWGTAILAPNNGSTGSENWVGVEKVAPATPYVIDTMFRVMAFERNYQTWGIFIRDSGSGKWVGLKINQASGIAVVHQNSATANASTPQTIELPFAIQDMFLRMADDGTNLKFSISADGVNFYQLYSEARGSFLTTPDRIGWAVDNQTNSYSMIVTLIHWLET